MNGLKFILCLFTLISFSSINAQKAVLPALKDNQSAKVLITNEISNIEGSLKSNPSKDLTDKLDLFKLALEFLDEPSIIKTTTEYAITSAFLNNEVDKAGVPDQIAFERFYKKVWNQNFIDLLNLVKL